MPNRGATRKRTRAADEEDAVDFVNRMDVDEGNGNPNDNDVDMKNAVDVTFNFHEPFETDFHGVKVLLAKSFEWCKKEPILDLTELTDIVVNQGNIGTTLQSDDGFFGICTAINLRQYKDSLKTSMEGFVQFLENHCPGGNKGEVVLMNGPPGGSSSSASAAATSPSSAAGTTPLCARNSGAGGSGSGGAKEGPAFTWRDMVLQKNTGLLVNERLINLPDDLAPPLHKCLVDGIAWSQTTPECPEEERPFYSFDHFLGIAKCWKDEFGFVYALGESETYVRHSVFHHAVPVGHMLATEMKSCPESATTVRENEYRMVYLLPATKLHEVVKEVTQEMGKDPAGAKK
eukprot:g6425.t1